MTDNSSQFLQSLLRETWKAMPELIYGYYFDQSLQQHVVRVSPEESYTSDEFAKVECDIVDDFIKSFPNEGVLFVSDSTSDSTIPLATIILSKYQPDTLIGTDSLLVEARAISGDFPFAYPEIHLDQNLLWFHSDPKELASFFVDNLNFGGPSDAGENNYALAA
jgi:hypothetical protein